MANKILQIDLQNDITPQIGSYDNTGSITPNNWLNEGGVYSLGPTNVDGTTPYYWFTPTKEVTDFDLCWEDYQDHSQTTAQYHLEIGDSAGNVVLSASRSNTNYYIGPVNVGAPAYQTWHKILVEVRKASASSSTVTAYVDGKKVATSTSDTLLTSAKIALLGHVPNVYYWQNAGQRLRYVTIYDRSYSSKGVNLDGIMTTITGFVNKLKGALSTVAFSGSYNDLSDKPTISTVNDGTLTIQQNGTNVQTFTANTSTNKTANIQCVDLSTAQTIGGVKTFSNGVVGNVSGTGALTLQARNGTARVYLRDNVASNFPNTVNLYSIVDGQEYGVFLNGNSFHPVSNDMNLGTSSRKWSKVYSDDVVHTTGNETISGVKTFSDIPIVVNGKSYVSKINANRTDGTQTGFSAYNGFKIVCNNDSQGWDNTVFALHIPEYSPTKATVGFKLYDCIEGSSSYKGFGFSKIDNDYQLFPTASNAINLGTSTNKWKSFNGLNPGALSLPSTSSNAMMQIDTTSWVLDGVADIEYTPSADGYLTFANDQRLEWIKGQTQNDINYGIYRFVYKYDSDIGGIQGVTIPCIKGKKVIMKIKGTGFYNALFVYCQGNV